MNLDIMSLMAASAAVATSVDGDVEAGTQGNSDGSEGSTFGSILQSLTGQTSETEGDIDPLTAVPLAALDDELAGAQGDMPGRLLVGPDGTPIATQLATATGQVLPPDGKELPVAALENILAPATDTTTPAGVLANAPAQSAQVGQVVAATMDSQSAGARDGAARTGWFSGADVAGASVATAPAATSTQARGGPLLAAESAALPTTAANPAANDALGTMVAKAAGQAKTDTAVGGKLLGSLATVDTTAAATDQPRALASLATSPLTSNSTMTHQLAATAPAASLNMAAGGWDKALGQRLVFMAANGIDGAELRLDPPALGTVHVKLSLQGDQAQLLMQASNPAAREALETALPRLRDMFDANGLQLDSAQVADRESAQREQQQAQTDSVFDGDEQASGDMEGQRTRVETLTLPEGRIYEKV